MRGTRIKRIVRKVDLLLALLMMLTVIVRPQPVQAQTQTIKVLDLGTNTTVSWTEGAAPQVLSTGLIVNTNSTISFARAVIGAGYEQGADRLSIGGSAETSGTVNGLNWAWDAAKGELSVTGDATRAAYQAALRQVTFHNTSDDPKPGARTVHINLGPGQQFAGNGHFYEYYPTKLSWTDARTFASSLNYFGKQGYLATMTSQAETDFVLSKLQSLGWLGGSDATNEGDWRWVTGPEGLQNRGRGLKFWSGARNGSAVPGVFVNWRSNQPDNFTSSSQINGEDYLQFYSDGKWNDLPNGSGAVTGLLVEFGGLPNEPASVVSGDVTVNVIAVNDDPTDIQLSQDTIPELEPIGTVVGTFSATDPDGGPSYTYSLVAGAGGDDNAAFTIQGTELRSTQVFDFETKNSYSIRVRVEDGHGGSFEKALTVAITNVDAPPTFVPVDPNNRGLGGLYGLPYHFAVVAHGEPHTITYGASGLPPGLSIDPATGQITGAASDTGTFTATVTAANGIAPDASMQLVFHFAPKPIFVQATDLFIKQGSPVPPLTFSVQGFRLGDDVSDLDVPPVLSTTSDTSVPGQYPIGLANTPADDHYVILASNVTGTLTIDAKDVPVITWPSPADIAYGTPLDITQLNATANVTGTFVYSPAKGTVLGAGAGQLLEVTFTPFDTVNYASVSASTQIAVTPVPLSITANSQTAYLGDPLRVFTAQYAGFVNGDGPNDLDTPVQFSNNVPPTPTRGTYDIYPFGATDANYDITFVKGSLTLALRPQAPILGDFPPVDGEYGAPYHHVISAFSDAGTVTFTLEAGSVLPPGLTFTAVPTASIAIIEGTPTQAGTFGPLVVKATNNAGSTTSPTGEIEIRKAVLILSANDRTIRQGTAPEPPALTGHVSGLRLNDTEAVLSSAPDYATSATPASPVGNYAITLANSPTASNYLILPAKGTLTIVDKDVPVIIWPAPATIAYGTPLGDSQLNAQSTVTGTTTAVPGTFVYNPSTGSVLPAGNGQILQTAFTPDSDAFTPLLASTQISVTRVPLQITADNQSIIAGEPAPTLTVTYVGFVNGEGPNDLKHSAVASTNANTKKAGTYPIIVSGAKSGNYDISYVPGTLTVALGCTVDGSSTGAPGSTFPYTARGFGAGENVNIVVDGTTIGSVVADADGVVKAALYLDPDAPLGAHTVTNSGPTGSVDCSVTLDSNTSLLADNADRTTVIGRIVGNNSTIPYVIRGCAADEQVLVVVNGLFTDVALADGSGNLDGRMFVGDVPDMTMFEVGAFCSTQEHVVLLLTDTGAPTQTAPGTGILVEPIASGPDSYIPFTPCGFQPNEVVEVKVDGQVVGTFTADANGCLDGLIQLGPDTPIGVHTITAGSTQEQVAIVPGGLARPNPGGKPVLSNVNQVGSGGSKFPVVSTGHPPGSQAVVTVGPMPDQQTPIGTVTVDPTGTATVVVDPVEVDNGIIYVTIKTDNGSSTTSKITVDPQGPQHFATPGVPVLSTRLTLYLPTLLKQDGTPTP